MGYSRTVNFLKLIFRERYRAITSAYYRNAMGILLIYDITKRESFENLERWLKEIEDHSEQGVTISLVGNKLDLNHLRQITEQEGKEFMKKYHLNHFQEVSAYDGSNVFKTFNSLTNCI